MRRLEVFSILAASLAFLALRLHYSVTMVGASPDELMAGTALLPFQYRDLIPALLSPFRPPVGVFLVIEAGFVAGTLFAASALLRRINASPLWLGAFYAMMLANYIFPPVVSWFLPSDVPAVFFATLGLLFLYDGRLRLFYALLPVAILNRETFAVLCLIFALDQIDNMPRPAFLAHLGAQAAIVVAVKAGLWWAFRGNAGEIAAPMLDAAHARYIDNMAWLANPRLWLAFAGLWPFFLVRLPYVQDRFFYRAGWAWVPFFLAMTIVANLYELRVFGEMLPLMLGVMALPTERLLNAARPGRAWAGQVGPDREVG